MFHRVIPTRVDLGLHALEFAVDVVHTLQTIATDTFAMFAALKWHDALVSLHADGRTKQSVFEVAAALHSLACVESFLELTEAMSVKPLAKDKFLSLDRKCNQRDRRDDHAHRKHKEQARVAPPVAPQLHAHLARVRTALHGLDHRIPPKGRDADAHHDDPPRAAAAPLPPLRLPLG